MKTSLPFQKTSTFSDSQPHIFLSRLLITVRRTSTSSSGSVSSTHHLLELGFPTFYLQLSLVHRLIDESSRTSLLHISQEEMCIITISSLRTPSDGPICPMYSTEHILELLLPEPPQPSIRTDYHLCRQAATEKQNKMVCLTTRIVHTFQHEESATSFNENFDWTECLGRIGEVAEEGESITQMLQRVQRAHAQTQDNQSKSSSEFKVKDEDDANGEEALPSTGSLLHAHPLTSFPTANHSHHLQPNLSSAQGQIPNSFHTMHPFMAPKPQGSI